MKKIAILIFSALFVFLSESKAQVSFNQTKSNPSGAISNSSIDTMTISLTKGYSRVLIGMTYARSANTAGGTAILEYRISSTENYKSDAGDTLTVSNVATQTLYWNKTNPARDWRIRVGGATTVTATAAAKLQTD